MRFFKKPLPDTLPELIEIAVEDAKKVGKDKRYKLAMWDWHRPGDDGKCNVCLAGSVIAMRDGVKPTEDITPHYFPLGDDLKLQAIDRARTGSLITAALLVADASMASTYDVKEFIKRIDDGEHFYIAMKAIKDAYNDRLGRAPWSAYLRAADLLRRHYGMPHRPRPKRNRKAKVKRKSR